MSTAPDNTLKKEEKKARFSWATTRMRLALGRAALAEQPYAAPFEKTEEVYMRMGVHLAQELGLKPDDVKPPWKGVREKYNHFLKEFRVQQSRECRGMGTTEEYAAFQHVWTEVAAEAKQWKEEEAKDAEAENKKRIRAKNAERGAQVSNSIMNSHRLRTATSQEGAALAAATQLDADITLEKEGEEANQVSQESVEDRAPAPAATPDNGELGTLSFTRKRDKPVESAKDAMPAEESPMKKHKDRDSHRKELFHMMDKDCETMERIHAQRSHQDRVAELALRREELQATKDQTALLLRLVTERLK
eukprot:m51a1_g5737 hypothetical protein (305) ;mRNA; r:1145268-1146182